MHLYFQLMFMRRHMGCIFVALRYGSQTLQKPGTQFFPPNLSSGSIIRRWFSPEGLNFLGVNCQSNKNTSITTCYEIVWILYIMVT